MAKGFILLTMKNKVELVTGIFIQEYSWFRKSRDLDFGGRTPFWRTMLKIFDTTLQEKTFPRTLRYW
jgi:hypothetical protein